MGKYQVRYLVKKRRSYFWEPRPNYMIAGKCLPIPDGLKARSLGPDEAQAIKMAKALYEDLTKWRKQQVEPPYPARSIGWLIAEYKKSPDFLRVEKSTQATYSYGLENVREYLNEKKILDKQAAAFTREHARLIYNHFSARPRTAREVISRLRGVYNYGAELGVITYNPFANMRLPKEASRPHIWLHLEAEGGGEIHYEQAVRHVAAFAKKAEEMGHPSMAHAVWLGLFSLLRLSDLLNLAWSRYDGEAISLIPSKTKRKNKRVYIPVDDLPAFRALIDGMPRKGTLMLLTDGTEKQYAKERFNELFRKIATAAGIPKELQFRDLRRSGMVLYALAGATIPQIAAISGHSKAEASQIIETYIPSNPEFARGAARKLKAFAKPKRTK